MRVWLAVVLLAIGITAPGWAAGGTAEQRIYVLGAVVPSPVRS